MFTNDCNSNFVFYPTSRIDVPAGASAAQFSVQYIGSTIPPACQLNFTISSLTSNNYILATPSVYLSATPSFDLSSSTPPMLLQLTTSPMNSTSVGKTIVSNSTSTSSSSSNYYTKNTPTLYNLTITYVGSNTAHFTATTSVSGTIYFVVLASGTPLTNITQTAIYAKTLSNAISYSSSVAALNTAGVNTVSNLTVSSLKAQHSYIIGAYINSTVGNSAIVFQKFTTAKASNGAAIKLAFTATINTTQLISYLSSVLRIQSNRISILTSDQIKSSLSSTYKSTVMNHR